MEKGTMIVNIVLNYKEPFYKGYRVYKVINDDYSDVRHSIKRNVQIRKAYRTILRGKA